MNIKPYTILIIDDDQSLCEILTNTLEYVGYKTQSINSGKAGLQRVGEEEVDLVLLDLKLPDISGMKILEKIKEMKPFVQVVMVSGQGTIHTAVEATKIGAYDFLEKPLDSERVLLTIKNALDRGKLEKENAQLLESVKEHYIMVGESPKMRTLKEMIQKASATNSKVLIEGENGTGKELVARAIHHNSARAAGPFVAVNCAAIPETLIESELFGHRKGAFTGAIADKPGRFQMAEGGTIFLDEIGDMSLMTQAKMLRTLEEECIEVVGGKAVVPIDVRVIAATNKDLQKQMKMGEFREDLYFRLNVLTFQVPPLRERKEDIPLLVDYFLRYFCAELGVGMKRITGRAMNRLMAHSWPGNVRELRNLVEKLIVLVGSEEIHPQDISSVLQNYSGRQEMSASSASSLKDAKIKFEREFILEKLFANNWNIKKTSEILGIPRTYLHKKIKMLDIEV